MAKKNWLKIGLGAAETAGGVMSGNPALIAGGVKGMMGGAGMGQKKAQTAPSGAPASTVQASNAPIRIAPPDYQLGDMGSRYPTAVGSQEQNVSQRRSRIKDVYGYGS